MLCDEIRGMLSELDGLEQCSTTSRSRKRIAAKPRKLRTSRQKFVRIGRLTLVAMTTRGRTDELTMAKRKSKGAYMISSVAEMYGSIRRRFVFTNAKDC